ncbi:hypothetical protein SOVF_195040 [Spinacia oleracea]|nr:hypothetical protein SOVF_195040 [Spinacia oleracea]
MQNVWSWSELFKVEFVAVKKKMGLVSILLKWNELDPPSEEEKLRNERICRLYHHNRNPFVDHPEYANLIWTQVRKVLLTP